MVCTHMYGVLASGFPWHFDTNSASPLRRRTPTPSTGLGRYCRLMHLVPFSLLIAAAAATHQHRAKLLAGTDRREPRRRLRR